MTLKQITNNIYQSNNDSNIYIIKDLNIAIDAGNKEYYEEYENDIKQIQDPNKITTVILTHLHYDHIGCFKLFPNAKFYCSDPILKDFKDIKIDYILNSDISNEFNVKLHPISELKLPEEYQILETKGHCKSCICIYDKKNKILFSGDTLFNNQINGRTDLPTSDPDKLIKSLEKLKNIEINILCPGHNY